MKYLPLILIFSSGCAELQKALNIAGDIAPPVADAFNPGLGTTIGAIIGGVSVIGGGITTLIVNTRRKRNK